MSYFSCRSKSRIYALLFICSILTCVLVGAKSKGKPHEEEYEDEEEEDEKEDKKMKILFKYDGCPDDSLCTYYCRTHSIPRLQPYCGGVCQGFFTKKCTCVYCPQVSYKT